MSSVYGHQITDGAAVNYSVFPTPPPESPLRESPLTGYPPLRHYGTAGGRDEYSEYQVKTRGGDYKGSNTVVAPYYKGHMGYAPVVDSPNSEVPIHGIHLYHHPSSLPSMKSRMVLYEKGLTWKSHVVDLAKHEHYEPSYVQMNQRAVLPTLTTDGRVTTDDTEILYYVNSIFPGIDLVPNSSSERKLMEYFIDLISKQNIEALAFGNVPGVHKRTGKSPFPARRNRLHELMSHYQNSHYVEVYKNKEQVNDYQENIVNDPTKMQSVYGNVVSCLAEIEHQLENGPFAYAGWLVSDYFTLADIHALCTLRFLDILGLKSLFAPQTLRYYEQGKTRQTFIDAGDKWFSAWKIFCEKHLPTTCHKVGFFTGSTLLVLALLGAIGFGIWRVVDLFFGGAKKVKVVVTEAPKYVGLRGDVVDVIKQPVVHQGSNQPWMRWALWLFPLLICVPLLLWFFGCLKCSKRGSKTHAHQKPSARSRSNSISSSGHQVRTETRTAAVVQGSDSSDALVIMKETTTTTQII